MPYPLIILEGCNGAGKTTIARGLVSQAQYRYVHCPYDERPIDLRRSYEERLGTSDRVVFDRCFPSEWVYGHVCRGRSRLDWSAMAALFGAVRSASGIVIFLCPSMVTIVERAGVNHDRDRLSKLSAAYMELAERAHGLCDIFVAHSPIDPFDILRGFSPT